MCFFFYSPDHSIQADYVSEKIFPSEKKLSLFNWAGTSQIYIDLFLTNNEQLNQHLPSHSKQLKKIYVIYPNILFSYDHDKNTVDFQKGVTFKDVTCEFIRVYHEGKLKGRKVRKAYPQFVTSQYIQELNIKPISAAELHYEVRLVKPDSVTLDDTEIKCFVHGDVQVNLCHPGEITGVNQAIFYRLLEDIGKTFLTIEFEYPIEIGETRWVRFMVEPTSTSSSSPKSVLRQLVEIFFNLNNYPYEIKGPYNVYDSLIKRGELFIKRYTMRITARDSKLSEYVDKIQKTVDAIKNHIGDASRTKFLDWRLEVFSNRGSISGIREYGIFKISGSLANVVTLENNERHTVYTWKTGRRNVCPNLDFYPILCNKIITNLDTAVCDDDAPCYPYSGHFRIAYTWRKDNAYLQFLIVFFTIVSLFYFIPFSDIASYIWKWLNVN